MRLSTELGLGPGDITYMGTQLPQRKEAQQPPNFPPCLLWPNGRSSQQLLSSFSDDAGESTQSSPSSKPKLCTGVQLQYFITTGPHQDCMQTNRAQYCIGVTSTQTANKSHGNGAGFSNAHLRNILPFLHSNKCSAAAEMGDRLTTIDMDGRLGAVHLWGRRSWVPI